MLLTNQQNIKPMVEHANKCLFGNKTKKIAHFIHFVTWFYVFFLTMLLWLPDPRVLLFGFEPSEGPKGYAHLITFSLLGFLIELDRKKQSRFFWATLLIFYALLTEIVQEILPIRTFDLADIVQDFAGIFVGLWTGTLCRTLFCRSFTKS